MIYCNKLSNFIKALHRYCKQLQRSHVLPEWFRVYAFSQHLLNFRLARLTMGSRLSCQTQWASRHSWQSASSWFWSSTTRTCSRLGPGSWLSAPSSSRSHWRSAPARHTTILTAFAILIWPIILFYFGLTSTQWQVVVVSLRSEPGATGWKVQTNPLDYWYLTKLPFQVMSHLKTTESFFLQSVHSIQLKARSCFNKTKIFTVQKTNLALSWMEEVIQLWPRSF